MGKADFLELSVLNFCFEISCTGFLNIFIKGTRRHFKIVRISHFIGLTVKKFNKYREWRAYSKFLEFIVMAKSTPMVLNRIGKLHLNLLRPAERLNILKSQFILLVGGNSIHVFLNFLINTCI
mgnify:CR=1 FL=1